MSMVEQISKWPRPQARQMEKPQPQRLTSAEIHILPCIRREPMQHRDAPNNFAETARS